MTRSQSIANSRAIKNVIRHENLTDAYHDLYYAIEKVENISTISASTVQKLMTSNPSLGNLLHMNIS